MSTPAGERKPTTAQQNVLDGRSRVRVVRSAPGSGKTWLIAEQIRLALQDFSNRSQGVAALSFTNVATLEVRQALGYDCSHPHFVGTLDSFIYRYIVKPFAAVLNPAFGSLRVVPADLYADLSEKHYWAAQSLQTFVRRQRKEVWFNIFSVGFVGEIDGQPIAKAKTDRTVLELDPDETQRVLERKEQLWARSGRISHADASLLGLRILRQLPELADLIARRFPLILVDEFQDTGYYLAGITRELLARPASRGLVVGDPDQAIYGFNGATPGVFEDILALSGAVEMAMTESQRCAPEICLVANTLSHSKNVIGTSRPDSRGRTILAIYDKESTCLVDTCKLLAAWMPTARHVILTRKNVTTQKLVGKTKREKIKGSVPLRMLEDALYAFRMGDRRRALAKAFGVLGWTVLESEAPTDDDLRQRDIDPREWRLVAVQLLLCSHSHSEVETQEQWGRRVKEWLKQATSSRGWNYRSVRLPSGGKTRAALHHEFDSDGSHRVAISTIHGAKGETHDTTILFVPKQSGSRCPSSSWWTEDGRVTEEGRVAFVAMTRPRDTLIVCLHRKTHAALDAKRPEFLQSFLTCCEMHELPETLRASYGPPDCESDGKAGLQA